MTHVTCRLTAKNRDQLRNPTLGHRVWATYTFLILPGVRTSLFNSLIYHAYLTREKTSATRTEWPNSAISLARQKNSRRSVWIRFAPDTQFLGTVRPNPYPYTCTSIGSSVCAWFVVVCNQQTRRHDNDDNRPHFMLCSKI